MEALLSNEFVVLALDALLHVASVVVLGGIVIVASKLLSKGHVDAKLTTGLIIAALLVAMRVFLLNNVHRVLDGFDVFSIMAAVGFVLFLTAMILVYKLVTIPLVGTMLSSIAIVAAQLALAHYTPILSLKLMPEGQRFAEYAGVSNERTKQLMAQAENFQEDSRNNIARTLKEALSTIAFLSSDKEQETLSKDMASGVRFIQERRAYMDSLSEEELAEYRAAMSDFMKEQGVDLENRYSLSNLKNATPEDLENLASFMKDMNKAYGFTDDMPQGSGEDDDLPPTLDSLRKITQNLKGIKIGDENSKQFASLIKDMMDDEDFDDEMAKVRSQIADLKANSGQLVETFRGADMEGMRRGLESATGGSSGGRSDNYYNPDVPPDSDGRTPLSRGERLFSLNSASRLSRIESLLQPFSPSSKQSINSTLMDLVLFEQTGYDPTYLGEESISADSDEVLSLSSNRVDYYIPVNTFRDFPEQAGESSPPSAKKPPLAAAPPPEDLSSYFPASALKNSLTEDYVLRVPKAPEELSRWLQVANTIRIGAWFEGTGGANKGTVFIDGIAYRSGEFIERKHRGERYLFRFEGVQEGQILITSLKRESTQESDSPNQSPNDS